MHGVGGQWVEKAFTSFDFDPAKALLPVPEQFLADPNFPTVAFPNPEEGKGGTSQLNARLTPYDLMSSTGYKSCRVYKWLQGYIHRRDLPHCAELVLRFAALC